MIVCKLNAVPICFSMIDDIFFYSIMINDIYFTTLSLLNKNTIFFNKKLIK